MKTIEHRIKLIEDMLAEREQKVLYLNNIKDILSYGKLVNKGEHVKYKTYVKTEIENAVYFAFAPQ